MVSIRRAMRRALANEALCLLACLEVA